MSRHADVHKVWGCVTLAAPFVAWIITAKKLGLARETKPPIKGLLELIPKTFDYPPLYLAMIAGLAIGIFLWVVFFKLNKPDFMGYKYDYRLRGSDIVSSEMLNSKTKDKSNNKQVNLATIKMPLEVENLQTLIVGSTGSAKTLVLTHAIFSILLRGDRQVIVDPDGFFVSLFYKKGDVILNAYDQRSPGWSIFNEMKEDYDFDTYSYSLVPLGKSSTEEEWNGYGRLLVSEVARKLSSQGIRDFDQLYYWCLRSPAEDLELFCKGTKAESLFIGTEKTLGSARFVLSNKLSAHLVMSGGDFSIRDFLNDGDGNLFITWREDQMKSLQPLISTWVDIICNAILSLSEDESRRIWLHTDELASLDKLAALEPALTKGRKKGLRIMSCIQSISQLQSMWGDHDSVTLRSCYRNLVVLGGSRADDITSEVLSKALGEFEVVRKSESKNYNSKGGSGRNNSEKNDKDRVVSSAEISNLGDREGYVALTRGYPIAKVTVPIEPKYKKNSLNFVAKSELEG